ncbi:hypothetical protein BKA80DRAFT_298449 [Phyllosticta citrichinensis]
MDRGRLAQGWILAWCLTLARVPALGMPLWYATALGWLVSQGSRVQPDYSTGPQNEEHNLKLHARTVDPSPWSARHRLRAIIAIAGCPDHSEPEGPVRMVRSPATAVSDRDRLQ